MVSETLPDEVFAEAAVPAFTRMSVAGGETIRGTIVRTDEARMVDGRRDGWAVGCVLAIVAGLVPVAIALWFVVMSLHLLLWVFGLGMVSLGGGCGLIASLLLHHILERALRRPEPMPVYHHVVEVEGHGQQKLVRQDGEFAVGKVYNGNQVRLHGRERGGVFVVTGGYNESLQVPLRCRQSGWRLVFVVLATAVMAEYVGLYLATSSARGFWW